MSMFSGRPDLAEVFDRQAKQASVMAQLIDASDSVIVAGAEDDFADLLTRYEKI